MNDRTEEAIERGYIRPLPALDEGGWVCATCILPCGHEWGTMVYLAAAAPEWQAVVWKVVE